MNQEAKPITRRFEVKESVKTHQKWFALLTIREHWKEFMMTFQIYQPDEQSKYC